MTPDKHLDDCPVCRGCCDYQGTEIKRWQVVQTYYCAWCDMTIIYTWDIEKFNQANSAPTESTPRPPVLADYSPALP